MSANDEMKAAIEEKMADGMTRERAVKAVFKEDPDLQQRVIDEANEGRGPNRAA